MISEKGCTQGKCPELQATGQLSCVVFIFPSDALKQAAVERRKTAGRIIDPAFDFDDQN